MSKRARRSAGLAFVGLIAGPPCFGQQAQNPPSAPSSPAAPQAQPAPQTVGLESPWDVRKILAALTKDNEQFKSLLVKLNPQEWYDKKGAPNAYIVQWTTAQRQANDVMIAMRLLSAKTESLSLALDTYFRLEALEVSSRSLDQGAHTYGDRATADKLSELLAQSFSNRERFRDYIRDLAESKEQDFKIADEEAQRCRGMISKEPASTSKRSKRY